MLSDSQFGEVFNASPDGILIVDDRGVIEDVNDRATALFGWDRRELVGQNVECLVPPRHRLRHTEHRAQYACRPRIRPMGSGMLLHGQRKDGSQFPVEISLSPWQPADAGPMVVCTVRDMSVAERWRNASIMRVEAVEAERIRIAGELHDDIVQKMVFIKHRLTIQRSEEDRPGNHYRLVDLGSAVDEVIASVEQICRGLAPLDLRHFGLTFALRILFREWSEAGFVVHDDLVDVGRDLEPAKALALFRIAQESLSNARQHSGTEEAFVTMTSAPGWMEMEVRDAGVGFDPEEVARSGMGIGLLGMSERASMVGGLLQVRSVPNGGTRIQVRIPVAERPGTGEAL